MQLIMEPETIVGINKITTMETETVIQEKLSNGITEELPNGIITEEKEVTETKPEKVIPEKEVEHNISLKNVNLRSNGAIIENSELETTKLGNTEIRNEKIQEKETLVKVVEKSSSEVSEVNYSNSIQKHEDSLREQEDVAINETDSKDVNHDEATNGTTTVPTDNDKIQEKETLVKVVEKSSSEVSEVNYSNSIQKHEDSLREQEDVAINETDSKDVNHDEATNGTTTVPTDNDIGVLTKNIETLSNEQKPERVEEKTKQVVAVKDSEIEVSQTSNNALETSKSETVTVNDKKEMNNSIPKDSTVDMDVDDEKAVNDATEIKTLVENDANNIPVSDVVTDHLMETDTLDKSIPTDTQTEKIVESLQTDKEINEQKQPEIDNSVTKKKSNSQVITETNDNQSSPKENEETVPAKVKFTTKITEDTLVDDNTTLSCSEKELQVDGSERLPKTSNIEPMIFSTATKEAKEIGDKTLEKDIENPAIVQDSCEIIDCDDEKVVTISKSVDAIVTNGTVEPKRKSFCLANTMDIISDDEEEVNKNDGKITDDVTKSSVIVAKLEEKKKPEIGNINFANTLDILSDDEDTKKDDPEKLRDTHKGDNTNELKEEAKCINIDDDDDVMLIDEDTAKESKKEGKNPEMEKPDIAQPDSKSKNSLEHDKKEDDISKPVEVLSDSDKEIMSPNINEKPEINEKPTSPKAVPKAEPTKPLVPENFLKKFKTNVAEMTRDELEEFCLMKIVEGVIDRSNLSDIASKLKTMTQHVEEWKKKAMMLTKQNRDLQIVVVTVQEEQKKRTEGIVTPLKITRSVGMQVVMTETSQEKIATRRKSIQQPTNPAPKAARTYNQKSAKPTNIPPTPIPVPRLVPASANSPLKTTRQQNAQSPKVQMPNMVKTPPGLVQKVEKRPYSSIQSVTVDLTDDEPAPKQPALSAKNPQNLRLVSPQQLLAPRPQMNQNALPNNPRKVFIPINSPNNNMRPGQTIMIKSNLTGPRGPRGNLVRMAQAPVRMARAPGRRHPAPLPEAPKQPQLSNWKALPPEPDLKISKVENGIVISWKIEGYHEDSYEEIASYQLYAYQETSAPPSTLLWKKIGDVKALPLPMACTLTQFMAGFKYYFAVRAVDIKSRIGPFSLPGSILLLNK